ncbi:YxeA family protein [Listeria monocytogenes]|nr:YxeA family protein [Listeria monocytogenes]
MKKGLFGLLAAIFVLTMVVIEFSAPIGSAANTYYVTIKNDGKEVTKSKFKGYSFRESCLDNQGNSHKVNFMSTTQLKKNKQYKIVVQDNELLVQAKEINIVPLASSK